MVSMYWTALLLLAGTLPLSAQVFEVASIKLGDPASPESSIHPGAGMVRIKGMTLKGLIVFAYNVKEYQVGGGPKWLDGDRYDITAKLENEGMPAAQGA